MAKTLIGNVKGKDGRGIASISKTGTTGSVDTYTIKYTDNTTSTYTVNNSDSVSLQRQIVPSAAVESSATASQAYAAGQYVVVHGVLRKVKSAIAKGNTIGDSNSTATTVTGEFANFARVGTKDSVHSIKNNDLVCEYTKRNGIVFLYIDFVLGHKSALTAIPTKMPAGYRPISGCEPYFTIGHLSSGGNSGMCKILSDGTIKTLAPDDTTYYAGAVAYPAE